LIPHHSTSSRRILAGSQVIAEAAAFVQGFDFGEIMAEVEIGQAVDVANNFDK
jgi:hypothetical protein